jgi:hypothetical protein
LPRFTDRLRPSSLRDDHAVAVHRIDPHVVVVADRRDSARQVDARLAAVERLGELGRQEVRLVLVVGRDREACVVVRAAAEPPVGAHHLPVVAAVLAAPQRSALRFLTVVGRHPVAGFDEGVDAVRIRARHLRRDLAERRAGQSAFGQSRPGRAAVGRSKQPAARAAARPAPRVDLQLPHTGEEHARVVRIHGDIGAACVLVDEQHTVPRSAAIGRPEDAALRLRAVRVAERAGEDDVGVLRVDDHARDPAGPLEAHARPRFAAVGRLVDAVADRDVAADECLAGAGPDHVRIAGCNRECPD